MDEETLNEEVKNQVIPAVPPASHIRQQPDKLVFQKSIQILDGLNIQAGNTNGMTIGTETTQKVGFHGKASVQAAAVTAPSGGGSGATDAVDISARTAINQIITILKNKGLSG